MIGEAALGIWMDVDPSGLDDFNAWYRRQHLPERLSVPGFLRGRRYEATGAGPVYFTLYETANAGVLSSAPYLERLDHPTEWTRRALPRVRHMVRNAYRRLGASPTDAVGGRLLTARIQPHAGRGPAVRAWLADEAVAALGAEAGVLGAGLFESETGGTAVLTEERKLVGDVTAAPPFLALLDLDAVADDAALARFWQAWGTRLAADVTCHAYRLLYGLAWLPSSPPR